MNKLGTLQRKTPLQTWDQLSLAASLTPGIPAQADRYHEWRRQNSPLFLFDGIPPIEGGKFIGQNSVSAADRILNGEFPFFGYTQRLGFPPQWQDNPMNRAAAPGGHWSKIDEFEAGDVKLWWEPSRFTWAFTLSRAYSRTLDERYAEAFWQLVESWLEQNPPYWGVNWKCGQEASFRVMALCFGLYAFAESPSSTAPRVARLAAAIAVHARRVEAYIEYALSQKNNHGISEGTGLWTIGLLFPELQGAARWKARGRQVIEREVRRQIYPDGSYVQHSVNYHRVMLQDLAWAIRLGERNDSRLAPDVYKRFRNSVYFLHALTDPENGWAPNYGANDGALVLSLSDCAYPDMRPALQSCHFIATQKRLYPPGPWDEEMVWLNGAAALHAEPVSKPESQADLDAETGGYYTVRSSSSWIMMRAARYRDRPSHADQLHLDLWWRGENVLCDSGTYSYNAPAPFDRAFASTRYHNTVTVDGRDQMTRLTRFLWADWANAFLQRSVNPLTGASALQGEHDGYAKAGVTHRRAAVQPDSATWVIVDDLTGRREHTSRLHWHMPDAPFQVVSPGIADLQYEAGNVRILLASSVHGMFDLVRMGERLAGAGNDSPDPARGWLSRYYGRKEPALSFQVECRFLVPVRFVTVVFLGRVQSVELDSSFTALLLGSESIGLSPIGTSPIFAQTI